MTPRASPAGAVRSRVSRGARPREGVPQGRGRVEGSRRFPEAGRPPSWARVWRVSRTPPGSESGACLQRGNSGTWESLLSPCFRPGMGDRVTKGPGVTWGFLLVTSPSGTSRTLEASKVSGRRATSEAPEKDRMAVVAAYSPWLGASAAAPPHMWKEQGQPARFLLSSWADRGSS